MIENIIQGIIIGTLGGAFAGSAVYLIKEIHECYSLRRDKKTVHEYLAAFTEDHYGKKKAFKTTREIASWCNLTESRVQYACSNHSEIYLYPGLAEDELWTIYRNRAYSDGVPAELD